MDPLTIGLSLIKFAPDLVKWFTGSDKDAAVAAKAVEIAQAVTGTTTPDAALKELEGNSTAVLDYRKAVLNQELSFQSLVVQNAGDINKTMQTETTSEHWPSFSWRPAIGFSFAAYLNAQWLLPLFHISAPVVDSQLMVVVGAILGVASYFRGKAQADPEVPSQQVTKRG